MMANQFFQFINRRFVMVIVVETSVSQSRLFTGTELDTCRRSMDFE